MIYLGTIQHTGTWFLIDFIKKISNQKVDLLQDKLKLMGRMGKITSINDIDLDIMTDCQFLHTHISATGDYPNSNVNYLAEPMIDYFIERYKTIITVRDPVLSLITRQNRHPELSHEYIIRSWDYTTKFYDNPNVKFFPIDLYEKRVDRFHMMVDISQWLGFYRPEHGDMLMEMAKQWVPKNATGHDKNNLKKKYTAYGDLKAIEKELPRDMEFLYSKPKIKDFLIKLGYDLEWFKKVK